MRQTPQTLQIVLRLRRAAGQVDQDFIAEDAPHWPVALARFLVAPNGQFTQDRQPLRGQVLAVADTPVEGLRVAFVEGWVGEFAALVGGPGGAAHVAEAFAETVVHRQEIAHVVEGVLGLRRQ